MRNSLAALLQELGDRFSALQDVRDEVSENRVYPRDVDDFIEESVNEHEENSEPEQGNPPADVS